MNKPSIGIIGVGNVGYALGRGLSQTFFSTGVTAFDKNPPKMRRLEADTGISVTDDWKNIVESAEVILLCVRTEQAPAFLSEAAPLLNSSQVVACLQAGVSLKSLKLQVAEAGCDIIRVITNINTASRLGFSIILQEENSSSLDVARREEVIHLFEAVGEVMLTSSEDELNTLSVLTGCAPAVTALFLEALSNLGKEIGFQNDEVERERIVRENVQATLKTMHDLSVPPQIYKNSVAAPGGVVERILRQRESEQLEEAVADWFRTILTDLQEV